MYYNNIHCIQFYQSDAEDDVIGAFAKLQVVTISFVVSVRLPIRMEQLGSHWTDFHDIWYLRIFRKCVVKIQVPLQYDRYSSYFT